MIVLEYFKVFPLYFIADFSILIPTIIAFYKRKWLSEEEKLFGYYICLVFLKNLITFIFSLKGKNNLIIYNFFLSVEIFMIGYFFIKLYSLRNIKTTLKVLLVFFVIFNLADIYYSNPNFLDLHNHKSAKYSYVLNSILIISFVLYYFYNLLSEVKVDNLLTFSIFWICCGLLIYHAGSVAIEGFLYEIRLWKRNIDVGNLQLLLPTLEIIRNVLFGFGLWTVKQY